MENKLVIPFGDYQIVAEINDMNEPDIPTELCVYLRDKENRIFQDICLVRQHYDIDRKNMEFKRYDDLIDCLVWGDSDCEDYTDKHVIGVYEEKQENIT